MSGGHYDYDEAYLGYIATRLDHDIEYNDVSWEKPVKIDGEQHYGFQLSPETIGFMKEAATQLRRLEFAIRELDKAISGDTCEKTFKKRVLGCEK